MRGLGEVKELVGYIAYALLILLFYSVDSYYSS
jgi:hypothetical protein